MCLYIVINLNIFEFHWYVILPIKKTFLVELFSLILKINLASILKLKSYPLKRSAHWLRLILCFPLKTGEHIFLVALNSIKTRCSNTDLNIYYTKKLAQSVLYN